MITINHIMREIKNVPANRLQELYEYLNSLTSAKKPAVENYKDRVLSFGGAFGEMPKKDFEEFVSHTQDTRRSLFDRKFDI